MGAAGLLPTTSGKRQDSTPVSNRFTCLWGWTTLTNESAYYVKVVTFTEGSHSSTPSRTRSSHSHAPPFCSPPFLPHPTSFSMATYNATAMRSPSLNKHTGITSCQPPPNPSLVSLCWRIQMLKPFALKQAAIRPLTGLLQKEIREKQVVNFQALTLPSTALTQHCKPQKCFRLWGMAPFLWAAGVWKQV